jgi:hypothetical protein
MINMTKQGNATMVYIREYIIDYVSDLADLPTDIPAGSNAFCLENGSAYILSGDKKWTEI